MSRSFASGDAGQALVIVALAMVVLMGTLVLAVDWGYGFASRRVAQNQADAAALAVGKLLASTYAAGGLGFGASREDAWCAAARARDANLPGTPTGAIRTLSLSFSPDGTTWTTISTADCSATGTTTVPAGTVFVRVSADATYASLFGLPARRSVDVRASARVRLSAGVQVGQLQLPPGVAEVPGLGLSGSTTLPNVAIWPITRHFDPAEYSDPSRRVTFWPVPGTQKYDSRDGGRFRGLIALAHESEASPTHQLITESDYTGTPHAEQGHPVTPPLSNRSNPLLCGGATWETSGSRAEAAAIACDLPNWFYYGYRGSISLGTDWAAPAWGAYARGAELPDALPTATSQRSSCGAPSYFMAPSCQGSSSMRGDWIETVNGDLTPNMAARMREFVQRYGRDTERSATLGKAVVVRIFLWDCAEHFTAAAAAGNQWDLMVPGRGGDADDEVDCSQIKPKDPRYKSVDRVHVFTVVPFTFYLNDIAPDGSRLEAYPGDAFGDAGECIWDAGTAPCRLNPLMNSAFLIPDD